MNKKIKLGYTIKAVSITVGVAIIVLSVIDCATSSVSKMTFPCQAAFLIEKAALPPVLAMIILSCLPMKPKAKLSVHLINEICLLIALVISSIDLAFDFRVEYAHLYGVFSLQTLKFMTVIFYAFLFTFYKNGKFRNATITIGAFLCAFKLVYFYFMRNPVLHERYSLSAICSVLAIALLVVIVSAFSDLDRFTYFSRSKKYPFPHYVVYAFRSKEEEYAILRVTERSTCIHNLNSGKSRFLGLYNAYNETGLDSQEAACKASNFKKKFEKQLKNNGERFL